MSPDVPRPDMTPPAAPRSFEIRALATRDSLAKLTDMLNRAYAPLAARGTSLGTAIQDEATTRERILSGQTFVAVHGRDLIGTVTVCSPLEVIPGSPASEVAQYLENHCCRFHQFAVDRAWQGHGMARALLRETETWARERGYRAMATDMAEGATELCAFYRHMGYQAVDTYQWPGKTYRSQIFRKDLDQSRLRGPLLNLARHHGWATARVWAALQSLDDDAFNRALGASGFSLRSILSEGLALERGLWWPRIAAVAGAASWDGPPAAPERALLGQLLQESASAWAPLVEACPHDRLHDQLRFERQEGEPEMLSFVAALLHVLDRAAHGRGQACAALAILGQPVPNLDLTLMLSDEAQSP